ncbi:MAG TPA: exopolysaccharide biosynthesis polyprenyl glycosylphosphotransferase [Acetobacteraceae bacterium]|nr:exopolysaccharide biosynthesis polyprenyl glycosylphosphotransferase [Acetobacteraceae bacterium]
MSDATAPITDFAERADVPTHSAAPLSAERRGRRALANWLADPALRGWREALKRAEDIALALALLALLWPLMLIVAAWIKLDSPGPVLFRQRRIGLCGREFAVFKFRTMHVADERHAGALTQAVRDDPRVTRAGRFLRRTSFDELPQLFNVLRKEMSVVGPRPHAPGTCAGGRRFEEVVPFYAARHRVRPGMTGLAQVRGWRGETDTAEKIIRRVTSDLEYIRCWSPWLDITLLGRTLGTMLSMRNAY